MLDPPDLVSPQQEMLAYETLWSLRNQTMKSLAESFRQRPGSPSTVLQWTRESSIVSPVDEHMAAVEEYIRSLRGFSVCLNGTKLYPGQLRRARHPIELFYYQGDIGLARAPSISVVGTRTCSPDGAKRAARLARELVEAGHVIVSGLAEGIDTVAMKAAIAARNGRVVGVIGTPIHECYPEQNRAPQELVARDHLLISQYAFFRYGEDPFSSKKRYFPERNGTMAALSRATVIVEASETSGTHCQARACLEQRKPLFILNSCFDNTEITWTMKYLEQGAVRVTTTEDIINELSRVPNDPSVDQT